MSENKEHKYGVVTVGAFSKEPRELPILSFIQSHFKDNRLISIMEVEDNGYVIAVENPESSGRGGKQVVWLSEESLVGFIMSCFFMFGAKGKSMDAMMRNSLDNNEIRYSYSDNLKPFHSKEESKTVEPSQEVISFKDWMMQTHGYYNEQDLFNDEFIIRYGRDIDKRIIASKNTK